MLQREGRNITNEQICCGISAQIVHANGTLAFDQPIPCGVVAPVV